MSTVAKVNALLNRAQRAANDAAVATATESDAVLRDSLTHIVAAVGELGAAQSKLYQLDPSLEYHYDPTRTPTKFMLKVRALMDDAETLHACGDARGAIDRLNEALALEPPALTYEVIAKRIAQLTRERG
jgi:hypothetical protein